MMFYTPKCCFENQREGIEYHDSTRSIRIKESGVCFIHLLPSQRRRNFLFFTCTLDSIMTDLIWLDSKINTGYCECCVESLQVLLSKITGGGVVMP